MKCGGEMSNGEICTIIRIIVHLEYDAGIEE